jgi:hypothetical protein
VDPQLAAGAVYGTLLALGVIAAFSEEDRVRAGEVLGGVLATTIVYWLTHAYAQFVARRALTPEGPWTGQLRDGLRHELPILESAIPPALALLGGIVGLWSHRTGIDLALAVGIAELLGWGLALGRRAGQSWPLAAGTGALVAAMGIVLVGLKALV